MRWRRIAGGVLVVALGAVGVGLLGSVGFGIWLTTDSGNGWLERRIEGAVSAAMVEGRFEIDGLSTNLVSTLQLDGLRLSDGNGNVLVGLGPSRATFDVTSLLTGPLNVHTLRVQDLVLDLGTGQERMALAELFGPPSDSTEPFAMPLDLELVDVAIEGASVSQDSALDLRGGVAFGAVSIRGPVFDLSELHLCAHLIQPGPTTMCVEGPLIYDGYGIATDGAVLIAPGTEIAGDGKASAEGVDLDIALGVVDLEALDVVASDVGISGTWSGRLTVKGPLDGMLLDGRLAGTGASRGALTLDGRVAVGDAVSWGGEIEAYGLHVEDLYPPAGRPVVLDGVLDLDATGVAFPDDLALGITYGGAVRVEDTYALEDTDVRARIEGGVLTLERGAFTGIAGQLDATGTIDLDAGPMDLVVRGDIDPAELAELGIEGIGGTGTANLRLNGDLKSESGTIDVRGRVVMAPFTYGDGVRFEELIADLAGSTTAGDFGFDLDVQGLDGDTYGVTTERLSATGLRAESRGGAMTVVGPAVLERVQHPSLGVFSTVDAEFDFQRPVGGENVVTAGLAFGDFDLQTFLGTGGQATVRVVGDAVDYTLALDAWGTEFAGSKGSYDLGTGRLEAEYLRVAPTQRLAWASEGPVRLTVVDGGIRDASLKMSGLHGSVEVAGDLVTAGALDGTVSVHGFQLDALAELFPAQFPGVSGELKLDARVMGAAEDIAMEGTLDVDGFWMEEVARWLDADGSFAIRDRVLTTDMNLGSAGEPLAYIDGTLPVTGDLGALALRGDGPVDLGLVLKPGALDRLEHITTTELGLPDGEVSARVDLTGRLDNPDLRMAGVIQTPVAGWVDAGRLEFDIRRSNSDLDLFAALREGLADRVRIEGGGTTRMQDAFAHWFGDAPAPDTSNLELWLDNMAISTVLDGLPAESVLRASDVAVAARGDLIGSFTASGSPYEPELAGEVHWLEAGLGNAEIDEAHLSLAPSERGLLLDARVAFEGSDVEVKGPLPIRIDLREDSARWADGELGLVVSGTGIPLELLSVVDRGISEADGRFSVSGHIGGTFANPIPVLEASVRDGHLEYAPMGLIISDMEADLSSGGGRFSLDRFTAKTTPVNQVALFEDIRASRIEATGVGAFVDGMPEELHATVELKDAWVMGTSENALRLDGRVAVDGVWPALAVRSKNGPLVVALGRFQYNSAVAEGAGPLLVSDRIVIHRDGKRRRAERIDDTPFYSDFDLNLAVDLKRNVEVFAAVPFFDDFGQLTAALTRADASLRVGGNMDIAMGPKGQPLFAGELEVIGGSVRALRTQFALDSGRISLLGGDTGATQLDLTGTSAVGDAVVDLRIGGTVDDPTLELTADGYDQTQVMMMLLTGQSPDELSGAESQAAQQEMAQLAAFFASTFLSGAGAGALTVEPDGTVKISAPWSSSVLTQLMVRPLADDRENRIAFLVEWSIARRLLFDIGVGDAFTWTGLSWETRF